MKCANCGYENQKGSKFCIECGEILEEAKVATEQEKTGDPINLEEKGEPIPPTQPLHVEQPPAEPTQQTKSPVQPTEQADAPPSPQLPQQPQTQGQPGAGAYPPPQGFKLDPRNGLYYTSQNVLDPATGQTVQQVTYFDTSTGEYKTVRYPTGEAPKKQGLSGCAIAAIIVGVIVILSFIVIGIIGYQTIKELDNYYATEDFFSDYDYGVDGYEDDADDYFSYEYGDSNFHLAERYFEEDNIRPMFKDAANRRNFVANSFEINSSAEDGKYVYYTDEDYFEDDDGESLFIQPTLYRLNTETGSRETIIDLEPGNTIYDFTLTDQKIVFSVVGQARGPYASYFMVDKSGGKAEFMFDGEIARFGIINGYLYLVSSWDEELHQYGLSPDYTYVYYPRELEEIKGNYSLSNSTFALIDEYLYVLADNNDNLSESIFKYDIKDLQPLEIFRSPSESFFHSYFIDGDHIFYSTSKYADDSWIDSVNVGKLGDTEAEHMLFSRLDIDTYFDGLFLTKVDDDHFVYRTDNNLIKAAIDNPTTPINQTDVSENDLFYANTQNWLVTYDSYFNLNTLEKQALKLVESNKPLVSIDYNLIGSSTSGETA